LIDLLLNWSASLTQTIIIQPTVADLASLYILNKFSIFVIFTVLAVGLAVSFYSLKYLNPSENAGPFFALILFLIVSLVGIVTAGDLLELFLFWEGMSVAAYGLVAFNKKVTVSLDAALNYLFLAGTGSLIALFGISIIYILTGSIQLSELALVFQKDPQLGALGLAMLIIGFGVEAAIFPLHTWLPDAYSTAPTPVSALLAGVVTETAVFALIKVISPTFTPLLQSITPSLTMSITQTQPVGPYGLIQSSLVIVAVLTMLIGNLGALGQGNIKRMLSYSSIAHVGYMLAALATFSTVGIVAILFHIWNHGLVKSSFFMLTGNRGKAYEDSDLANVKGLFHQSKLNGGMFALSSLGMLGVPPFGTFWSELLIIQSLLATQLLTFYALAVVVVLNIVFSVGYFSKVVTSVAEKPASATTTNASWSLTITPLLLLLLSLLTGFAPWLMLGRLS
ncbi:MAG TPA: proton-conducting transporter membrane subunit, partial [archaeon]|nr:proton-conducting transporter membrane subunit [archaeon]